MSKQHHVLFQFQFNLIIRGEGNHTRCLRGIASRNLRPLIVCLQITCCYKCFPASFSNSESQSHIQKDFKYLQRTS
jgi:hypothetical protein